MTQRCVDKYMLTQIHLRSPLSNQLARRWSMMHVQYCRRCQQLLDNIGDELVIDYFSFMAGEDTEYRDILEEDYRNEIANANNQVVSAWRILAYHLWQCCYGEIVRTVADPKVVVLGDFKQTVRK